MKVTSAAIESLWYEPGTAADAAIAANKCSDTAHRTWTGERVRETWAIAQSEGRLPNLMRPINGFAGDALLVVRKLKAGRVVA